MIPYFNTYSQQDWIVTKHRKKFKETRSSKLLAVDCEMVLCDDGNEALVKVCIVDENLEVLLSYSWILNAT